MQTLYVRAFRSSLFGTLIMANLLDTNPLSSRRRCRLTHTPAAGCEWNEAEPTEWAPTVTIGEIVTVRFYTVTALGSEQIIRHEDAYAPSKYQPMSRATVIAVGGPGFVY